MTIADEMLQSPFHRFDKRRRRDVGLGTDKKQMNDGITTVML